MNTLYDFTKEINAGIAEYKKQFLQNAKKDYQNEIIRTPIASWGSDLFDEYYDGTRCSN